MKMFITLLVTLFGFQSQAWQNNELDFVCRSRPNSQNRYPIRAALKQTANGPVREGVKVPFQLELKEIRPFNQEILIRPQVYQGFVTTEDVLLTFESHDKKVQMTIYMDELDQTELQFSYGKKLHMDCDEHRW